MMGHSLRAKAGASVPGPTSALFGEAKSGPIATIRRMLRRGQLRDDGWASVDGRKVRRLVGKRPAFPGRGVPQIAVRYYVDPDSYTPVAARIAQPMTARASVAHDAPRAHTDLRFLSFERLPLTAANARLLEIHPVGHPEVIHIQPDQVGGGGVPVVPVPKRKQGR